MNTATIDYGPSYTRCQHDRDFDSFFQCCLPAGHPGGHKNAIQLQDDARRNRNPTLEDIRKVIREEIEAALKRDELRR